MNNTPESAKEVFIERDGEISADDADVMYAKMRALAKSGRLPKRAVRVFIEMVQNLRLHGGGSGRVSAFSDSNCIFVRTVNAADEETVKHVESLAYFANAHAEELPSIIQKRRAMPMKQTSDSAGLGILEIRRLCGYDLQASSMARADGHLELVIVARMNHKSIL